MTADELKALQAPLKARFRDDPESAVQTLWASGELETGSVSCIVETALGSAFAGLHPAAGGDGSWVCSGDMLLEALVSCAGVTLCAVATALEIPVQGGTVTAEGDIDFRGTLGVDRATPIGFTRIRLTFQLDSDADDEQIAMLIKLTERYCVVLQTLKQPPEIEATVARSTE